MKRDKLIEYTLGVAGLGIVAPTATGALVVKTIGETIITDSFKIIGSFADGASDFTISDGNSGDFNLRFFYSYSPGIYFDGDTSGGVDVSIFYDYGGPSPLVNLTTYDSVDSNVSGYNPKDTPVFARSEGANLNGFQDDVLSYTGFQLTTSGRTHYGWVSFTLRASDFDIVLNSIAIETDADTAAPVPEPAHAALLLAGGALGLAAYRKKKGINRPKA